MLRSNMPIVSAVGSPLPAARRRCGHEEALRSRRDTENRFPIGRPSIGGNRCGGWRKCFTAQRKSVAVLSALLSDQVMASVSGAATLGVNRYGVSGMGYLLWGCLGRSTFVVAGRRNFLRKRLPTTAVRGCPLCQASVCRCSKLDLSIS